jgi:hypothetical protein
MGHLTEDRKEEAGILSLWSLQAGELMPFVDE